MSYASGFHDRGGLRMLAKDLLDKRYMFNREMVKLVIAKGDEEVPSDINTYEKLYRWLKG